MLDLSNVLCLYSTHAFLAGLAASVTFDTILDSCVPGPGYAIKAAVATCCVGTSARMFVFVRDCGLRFLCTGIVKVYLSATDFRKLSSKSRTCSVAKLIGTIPQKP